MPRKNPNTKLMLGKPIDQVGFIPRNVVIKLLALNKGSKTKVQVFFLIQEQMAVLQKTSGFAGVFHPNSNKILCKTIFF